MRRENGEASALGDLWTRELASEVSSKIKPGPACHLGSSEGNPHPDADASETTDGYYRTSTYSVRAEHFVKRSMCIISFNRTDKVGAIVSPIIQTGKTRHKEDETAQPRLHSHPLAEPGFDSRTPGMST